MKVYSAIGAAISCYLIATNRKKVARITNNDSMRYSRYDARDEKLIMALVVIRHGSRTPVYVVPNCEEANWDSSILLKTLPGADISCKVVNHDGGSQPRMVYDIAYAKDKMLKGGSPGGQLTILGQEQIIQLGKRMRERYIDRFELLKPTFDADTI